MLKKLVIKNIALIDYAEIDFDKGLNVLSGETGAGKSVIIESLNFALGAKADRTLIRSGQQSCMVECEFTVDDNKNIVALFDEFGFDQDDIILISRNFSLDGKGSIKLNGNNVTVSMLKKFTSHLVEVHGQSEHFELLSTVNQLDLIDKVDDSFEINSIKEQAIEVYSNLKNVNNEIDSLGGDEHQRLIRIDILNYQINEIENANLYDGEEEELLELRKKLQYQEKISSALKNVVSSIDDEGGVGDIIYDITRQLGYISDLAKDYSDLYERIEGLYSELDDVKKSAKASLDNLDSVDFDPDYVENRLEAIKKLKKKYGKDYAEIMQFLISAIEEKSNLENFGERYEFLLKEKEKIQLNLYDIYKKLSAKRKIVSKSFCERVLLELKELGMNSASFNVKFADLPEYDNCKFDSYSIDEIEFMFSANLGEPLKPLSSVISGGEMSRFMLAIKAQTAKYNHINTFLFDEIDAGISGAVAKTVSEKFARIAKDVQLIAITHLPQISAMADYNLLIEKSVENNKTTTHVKCLNEEEKIAEVCRLTGGSAENVISKEHALSIINQANNYKKSI